MGLFLRASSTLSTSDDLVHSATERDARAAPPQAQHAAEHWVKKKTNLRSSMRAEQAAEEGSVERFPKGRRTEKRRS